VLHAAVRVVSQAVLMIDGAEPEALHHRLGDDSGSATFRSLVRSLGAPGADPTLVVERHRAVRPGALEERVVLVNGDAATVRALVWLDVGADLATVESVKAGSPRGDLPTSRRNGDRVIGWRGGGVDVELEAPEATVEELAAGPGASVAVRLGWQVDVPGRSSTEIRWRARADDPGAAVVAAPSGVEWSHPQVRADDPRLARLVRGSLRDLAGLRMAAREHPADVFCAAGSPWYFTLFGRDSLWTARLLLPLGTDLAAGTLRALAAYQGRAVDPATAEAPGKILHELRRGATEHRFGMSLPPLYYGTVDATPLWVCLLHDAWRWGMPDDEVRGLLPALESALGWLVRHGDVDGDGLLEYVDESGHGLANQGWKDSADAIRFADGTRAEGPVALCEVQGYAYEAAMGGAALLDAFGLSGAEVLREWASALRARFRESFWVGEGADRRPALALDGSKRPVDSVTSNIGHLLGTGLLDDEESALVADRLARDDMRSGFGLRTMSSSDGGYWPLSYHCGSVWPHDTAVVVVGLLRCGRVQQARELAMELLAAGEHFAWRMPELYGGWPASGGIGPVPYPASCRPQAWSAAAGVVVLQAMLGVDADVPGGGLASWPSGPAPVGALRVVGLVVAGRPVGVELDSAGEVVAADGLPEAVSVRTSARAANR
jgi:glycogen debranching enzyme